MKKITRIFALALAFVMAFALQAPVNAAEKAAVNQEKAQATVQAGSFTHRVRSLYYNSSTKKASLTIEVNSSGVYRYQVQLLNYNKKKVVATDECSLYAFFTLKKNQLYYYRVRATSYNYSTGQYVPVSNWSYGYGINTGVCTVKLSGKKVRIKTPKVKGVKKFTLYMSTNRTKGYKKIKTVKSGKTITVSRFKKKSFKKYKDYYYYISSAKKQSKFVHSFYISCRVCCSAILKRYSVWRYFVLCFRFCKKQIGEFVLEEFLNMSVFIYLLYGLQM